MFNSLYKKDMKKMVSCLYVTVLTVDDYVDAIEIGVI